MVSFAAADQYVAYLVVRFHPNIGVPRAAVHWRSLFSDEVCHLNAPSRVPVHEKTHTYTHTHLNNALPQMNLNRCHRMKSDIHNDLIQGPHYITALTRSEFHNQFMDLETFFFLKKQKQKEASIKIFSWAIFSPDKLV